MSKGTSAFLKDKTPKQIQERQRGNVSKKLGDNKTYYDALHEALDALPADQQFPSEEKMNGIANKSNMPYSQVRKYFRDRYTARMRREAKVTASVPPTPSNPDTDA
jgi:hypothetical protein